MCKTIEHLKKIYIGRPMRYNNTVFIIKNIVLVSNYVMIYHDVYTSFDSFTYSSKGFVREMETTLRNYYSIEVYLSIDKVYKICELP